MKTKYKSVTKSYTDSSGRVGHLVSIHSDDELQSLRKLFDPNKSKI